MCNCSEWDAKLFKRDADQDLRSIFVTLYTFNINIIINNVIYI